MSVWHRATAPYTGEIVVGDPPAPTEVESAAAKAFEYARRLGDRLAWAVVLGAFQQDAKVGRPPPAAAIGALADVFRLYSEGKSMDEAFGLNHARPGFKQTLARRESEHSNARVFAWLLDTERLTVEEAKAWIDERDFVPCSGDAAYEHYKKLRQAVKGDHSE